MIKEQIKDELRRVACDYPYPTLGLSEVAYLELVDFSDWPLHYAFHDNETDMRTFFLIVAEAI